MDQAENIIFLGSSGVGKTHLATSLGIESAQSRRRTSLNATISYRI